MTDAQLKLLVDAIAALMKTVDRAGLGIGIVLALLILQLALIARRK